MERRAELLYCKNMQIVQYILQKSKVCAHCFLFSYTCPRAVHFGSQKLVLEPSISSRLPCFVALGLEVSFLVVSVSPGGQIWSTFGMILDVPRCENSIFFCSRATLPCLWPLRWPPDRILETFGASFCCFGYTFGLLCVANSVPKSSSIVSPLLAATL